MNKQEIIEDRDSRGNRVNWEVELWEWSNWLKRDTTISRKIFKTKTGAQEWINERIDQMLVVWVVVNRLTYDNINCPILPARKRMFEREFI